MMITRLVLLAVVLGLALFAENGCAKSKPAAPAPAKLPPPKAARPVQIPVEDLDRWKVEIFAGHASGGEFLQGPRRGSGVPGAMAFDDYGNAFVAAGAFVYAILSDDSVRLLAGAPGMPGPADGSADRACFGSLNAIALGPDGSVYVSDVGNFCIKKLFRDKDNRWMVATVAGQPGKSGHKDGPGKSALLQRPEGLAFDSKGNLYTMDQDWLRRISPDGQVVTLNPKGGTGKAADGPLETARFNRIMGSGPISIDADDNLYQSDLWNQVMRKADLKAATIATIVANQPKKAGEPPTADGDAMTEVRTFGINGAVHDPASGRIYLQCADENAIRCLCPDGIVRMLGPLTGGKGGLAEGPLKDAKGSVRLCGVDRQGRVYAMSGGLLWRFHRDPPYPKALVKKVKTPNPLLSANVGRPPRPSESPTVTIAPPEKNSESLAGGPVEMVQGVSETPGTLRVQTNRDSGAHVILSVTAAGPHQWLKVIRQLVDKPDETPRYAVRGQLLDSNAKGQGKPFDIAPSGSGAVVAFDGSQYVVAYEHNSSVYARRVSVEGKLLDAEPIKMGGVWERRPAIASNGAEVVITASRRPQPDPWGWSGPGAVFIGRLTRDGQRPELFGVNPGRLADGGFAGLVDRAQWKGTKGWPAGRPGGFHITQNGYWPHLYSAVCWDGATWVVAWVRGRMSGMNLADMDIFACRVDPATMMPTSEPVLVAGGDKEPGSQTRPALASLGVGTSLLVYQTVGADGEIKVAARMLAGGPLTGPARVEPKKQESVPGRQSAS